jgi:hypothetical protein
MIYISLTTVPKRLKYWPSIYKNLKSLLYQKTEKEYYVIFNIPKLYVMGDNAEYVIPSELLEFSRNNPKLIINRETPDYGPIIKIYGALRYATNPDDIIIVCDDDNVYHEDMVEFHVKKLIEYPQYVICFASDVAVEKIYLTDIENGNNKFRMHTYRVGFPLIKDVYVKNPGHNGSVSYKRCYFKEDFNEELFTLADGDDPLMGYYLKKHQICIMMVKYGTKYTETCKAFPIVDGIEFPEYSGGFLIREKNSQTIHGRLDQKLIDLLDDNFYIYTEEIQQ